MKRLIVDMSSIMWTCLKSGEDKEHGRKVEFEGKMTQVNGHMHGFENVVNHFCAVFRELEITPMHMIMVFEGKNSKALRQFVMPTYKGGDKKSHPEESYTEFNLLKTLLLQTFVGLGATACSQDGIESDDVVAYLALNLKGIRIIDSNDGDLAALLREDDDSIQMWKFDRGLLKDNHFGPFPYKHITLYKSLVGDTGDKIPGAKGFGDKAWLNLIVLWGYDGLDEMVRLIKAKKIDELQENVNDLKALKCVIENKDTVYKSWECAVLYPEKVNTMRAQLQWTAGMTRPAASYDDKRLKHWAQQTRLVHRGNFDPAIKFFIEKLPQSPFVSFDIETSSCDEADDWLEAARAKATDKDDDPGVDVFGASLTGFSMTFGDNMQYTYYVTIDHVEEKDVKNLTLKQGKQLLRCIPKDKKHVIQNVAFELPVVMENMGSMDTEEVPS